MERDCKRTIYGLTTIATLAAGIYITSSDQPQNNIFSQVTQVRTKPCFIVSTPEEIETRVLQKYGNCFTCHNPKETIDSILDPPKPKKQFLEDLFQNVNQSESPQSSPTLS